MSRDDPMTPGCQLGSRKTASTIAHVMHMSHLPCMSKMVQVRNVPERLHRELVRRARARGQTLTDYIQGVLEREVARPLPDEVFARIRARASIELGRPAHQLIREERAERREEESS
jgi:plasmid stability protein